MVSHNKKEAEHTKSSDEICEKSVPWKMIPTEISCHVVGTIFEIWGPGIGLKNYVGYDWSDPVDYISAYIVEFLYI